MSTNFEGLKDLASAIESIVIALGVLIGGGWALFRFRALKDVAKARAELEKATRELREHGNLTIEMRASQFEIETDSKRFISISLTITNVGNRTEVIRWADSKISGARVTCSNENEIELGAAIQSRQRSLYMNILGSTIDPGNSEIQAFLIPIDDPGLYFLEAYISGSPEETAASKEKARLAGFSPDEANIAVWNATTYFNVESQPRQRNFRHGIGKVRVKRADKKHEEKGEES